MSNDTMSNDTMSNDTIEQLVHLYSDAVVRRDAAQWGATWVPDGVWDLGRGRRVEGRDDIVAFWTTAMQGFTAVVQNVVNGTATVNHGAGDHGADSGVGRWYIIEHWQRVDNTRGILLAYYDDTYARVGGSWLFTSRKLIVQYSGPADLSGTFLNAQR